MLFDGIPLGIPNGYQKNEKKKAPKKKSIEKHLYTLYNS